MTCLLVQPAAPSYLDPSAQEIVFGLLALLALGSALLVVTARVVVHAALWLVVTLGALAGCYLVLTAEFVAWVQVLVYVGAVVVLLLFAAMLTRAPTGPTDLDSANRPVGAMVAVAAAATLITLLIQGFRTAYVPLSHARGSGAETIGVAVFHGFVLPFEVVSVLLLAALVGAVVLSRREVE